MSNDLIWQVVYGNLRSICRVSRALRRKYMNGFYIEVEEMPLAELNTIEFTKMNTMTSNMRMTEPVYKLSLVGPSRKKSPRPKKAAYTKTLELIL